MQVLNFRYIKDKDMSQELLFATYLEDDTRGELIIQAKELLLFLLSKIFHGRL